MASAGQGERPQLAKLARRPMMADMLCCAEPAGSLETKQAMLMPHKTLLARIAQCEARAEKAYDAMYDSRYPAAEYSDLKDYFSEAIRLARHAGLTAEAERLNKRLEHCKAVYRSQFTQS